MLSKPVLWEHKGFCNTPVDIRDTAYLQTNVYKRHPIGGAVIDKTRHAQNERLHGGIPGQIKMLLKEFLDELMSLYPPGSTIGNCDEACTRCIRLKQVCELEMHRI